MTNLKTVLLAAGLTLGGITGANAQMSAPYDLAGANVQQIESANSALAVYLNDSTNADHMLPTNIDELRQALDTNTALSAFFEENRFDPYDVVGVDLDEDGSLFVIVERNEIDDA